MPTTARVAARPRATGERVSDMPSASAVSASTSDCKPARMAGLRMLGTISGYVTCLELLSHLPSCSSATASSIREAVDCAMAIPGGGRHARERRHRRRLRQVRRRHTPGAR